MGTGATIGIGAVSGTGALGSFVVKQVDEEDGVLREAMRERGRERDPAREPPALVGVPWVGKAKAECSPEVTVGVVGVSSMNCSKFGRGIWSWS